LGLAKVKFDQRKFEDAEAILREIVEAHPDHHPTQVVLGQTLVASGKLDAFENWVSKQTDGVQLYPGYWIALGDWARKRDEPRAAIRCFLEAGRSEDPDRLQVWARLATLLQQMGQDAAVDNAVVQAIQQRSALISRFDSRLDRFTRTGSISREIALEIATTLESLGKLWEAEAWCSLALTLPEDDAVDVGTFRKQLIKQLRERMPWQLTEGRPEFSISPAGFPLPSIEGVVSRRRVQQLQEDGKRSRVGVNWKMDDEAEKSGLVFFGRTGEELDEPGIKLFQTLGCGGGTLDFDRDGWQDAYLAAAGGMPPERDSKPNQLFRNLEGRFVAVAKQARVGDTGFAQGIAVGDVNSDGFPDLLVLNYGPNRLFLNQGDGHFQDASARLPSEPY
ncbi:MAG: FG-GAP-like repeat-containing protein, partial [Planctomycetota bacterium]